jgi:hypothetical protein
MEPSTADGAEELRRYLKSLAPGKVERKPYLVELLAACWGQIPGSGLEGMTKDKLARIESVEWAPPKLFFIIERHGGTVMGSTRGALHCWTIDVDTWTADCDAHYSYRQIHERDAPLRIRPLVDEIAQSILDGKDDKRLKWSDGRAQVRVLVREFISGRFEQTRRGRRKKFRLGLNAALEPRG